MKYLSKSDVFMEAEINLQLYFTSDMHGYLLPVDYAQGGKQNTGLLSCAKSFKKDGNTLIIDAGDTLQGSPFAAYLTTQPQGAKHIAAALNKAGYDYITLGNHDFNYGISYLQSYLGALNATCICANVTGDLPLAPHTIHTLENGLKVGIVGIVTSRINIWEPPENLEGVTITDPFPAVKEALAKLKGHTDINICIYHGGFECDLDTDILLDATSENVGSKICRELDFDLLLTGHQHNHIEGRMLHGTYIVQPRPNATHYILIKGTMTEAGMKFSSTTHTPDGTYCPEGIEAIHDTDAKVQTWLDIPVGQLDKPLPVKDRVEMALQGSAIADFFNQLQLEATGADISCTSLSNQLPGFSREVRTRSIIANYPFSNDLITLEVTGEVLRQILERAATYLDLDKNGKPIVSDTFLLPKIEHYNYDFFAGLTYTANLHLPPGQRVQEIIVNGRKVNPQDKFSLCTSHYRASGTGGYDVYQECPILKREPTDISELMRKYISMQEVTATKRYPAPKFIY